MERARYGQHLQDFSARLLQDGKSKNTVASYSRDAGEFLAWLEENDAARVDHVTEEHIAGFVAGLANRELGERSKGKKLTSIRSFLVWARREGLVESYPRKLTFARVKSVIVSRSSQNAMKAAGA